jgi:hypothetical protein
MQYETVQCFSIWKKIVSSKLVRKALRSPLKWHIQSPFKRVGTGAAGAIEFTKKPKCCRSLDRIRQEREFAGSTTVGSAAASSDASDSTEDSRSATHLKPAALDGYANEDQRLATSSKSVGRSVPSPNNNAESR